MPIIRTLDSIRSCSASHLLHTHMSYQVLDILFGLGLIANALTQCTSLTVQFSDCRTITCFLVDSPALALYDPFGVDVPLNFDIINQSYHFYRSIVWATYVICLIDQTDVTIFYLTLSCILPNVRHRICHTVAVPGLCIIPNVSHRAYT